MVGGFPDQARVVVIGGGINGCSTAYHLAKLGYVRSLDGVSDDYLRSGRYELEVAARRVPAEIHLEPLYDPKNERIKR